MSRRRWNLRHASRSIDSLDAAWRLHGAQMDWTGKVDAKAAFALTIQGALLTAAVALSPDMNSILEHLLLGHGVLLVMAGLIVAASAVAPRLRSKYVEKEAESDFIYFGHARHWSSEALAQKLRGTDLTDQIARQVVVMADIAWKKHRHVSASIWLAVAGGTLVLVAGLVSRL